MISVSSAKYKGQVKKQSEFKVHDDQVSDLETQRELATAEWRNVDHKPHKADSHHSLLFPAEENNFVYLLRK